jgi:outer membrane protein TolC
MTTFILTNLVITPSDSKGMRCLVGKKHNTVAIGLLGLACGCRVVDVPAPVPPEAQRDGVILTTFQEPLALPVAPPLADAAPAPADTLLTSYVARALAANRDVQAARSDVMALKARIPQVTSLDDPMVQNGMWPFPSNGPQYSLMGYMPYEMMITQQFPWLGTLRLRGCVAEQEARAALWRLAEAQIAAAANVKQAYYNLRAAERVLQLLEENRSLAEEIVQIARARLAAGGSEQDVLRAEVAVAQIERERVMLERDRVQAQAELARLLHLEDGDKLTADTAPHSLGLPQTLDQLAHLAAALRPDLQARAADIERDRHEVALARKRYWPNFNVGVGYSTMTRVNNPSPLADGRDNVGLVLGFNLPIYRTKLDAGLREAESRLMADAQRYESDRDEAQRQVRALLADAVAQQRSLDLLVDRIAPKSRLALQSAVAGYRAGTLDFVTLNTAREELLEIEIEIARTDAAFGRALAALEQSVGGRLQ